MDEERKPTWNYILNDLALYSLLTKVLYSENVIHQDKIDLEHQMKLLQQERDKYKSIVEELKKYLKENLYFYSGYQGEDLEEDISIKYALDKIKELEEGK